MVVSYGRNMEHFRLGQSCAAYSLIVVLLRTYNRTEA